MGPTSQCHSWITTPKGASRTNPWQPRRPKHLQLVAKLPQELFYDLPPELHGKLWGGKYKGQRQTWFLVRFTGADSDIDLNAHKHPEFCEWKWVDPELLPELIVPFKREVYSAIVEGFRGKI